MHIGLSIHQKDIFFLHLKEHFVGFNLIYWTSMSGSYFLYGSILEKMWKLWEKRLFFWADMAGLGKYHTGGYGRIGVILYITLKLNIRAIYI